MSTPLSDEFVAGSLEGAFTMIHVRVDADAVVGNAFVSLSSSSGDVCAAPCAWRRLGARPHTRLDVVALRRRAARERPQQRPRRTPSERS